MSKPRGFTVVCWIAIISYTLLFLAGWASALWSILITAINSFSMLAEASNQQIEILLVDEYILALTYIIGLYQIYLIVRMLKKRSDQVRSLLICFGVSVGLAWCNSLWVLYAVPQDGAIYIHFSAVITTLLSCFFGLYFTRRSVRTYLNH